MYHLSRNQDKQDALYEELKLALPEVSSPVTSTVQENIPFLKACVKETLRCIERLHDSCLNPFFSRLKPVVLGNGRTLQMDTVIAGYQIPKNVLRFLVNFLALTVAFPDTRDISPPSFGQHRKVFQVATKIFARALVEGLPSRKDTPLRLAAFRIR